jgi:hypothetical protein
LVAATIGIVASLSLDLAAASANNEPPCEAVTRVEPKQAYVGEQVLYGLEIHRREDVRSIHWARPLATPGFRMESLPTRTDLPTTGSGSRSLAIEERRALFPTRSGELEIPPASLRCTLVSEHGEREVSVAVPAVRVRVLPLPDVGRPPGFAGVVGRLEVSSRVEPSVIELGGSASLTVLVEGRANLWELPVPFDPDAAPIADVDLLARPSEIARDAGRGLRLRRYFTYDLVPRAPGTFEVPEILVPYFDPESTRFAVARAPALAVEVRASPGPAREARSPGAPGPREVGDSGSPELGLRLAAAALVVSTAALALIVWARARRRTEPRREVRALLDQATQERREGEIERSNALIARALRAALEGSLPGARSRSAEELVTSAGDDPDLRHASTLLSQLDNARFSDALHGAPDPDAASHAALRISARQRSY